MFPSSTWQRYLRKIHNPRGFTIIELLVVIAIIGVIISIGMVDLMESREQSENTQVIAQVEEYQKAFQLYFTEHGGYPGTGSFGRRYEIICLGDEGTPLDCLDGNSDGVPIQTLNNSHLAGGLRNRIQPYLPSQPHILQHKGGNDFSSPAYSGCADFENPSHPNNSVTRQCGHLNYSIWFVLKGTGRSCGRATLADPEFAGVYTLCRLQE